MNTVKPMRLKQPPWKERRWPKRGKHVSGSSGSWDAFQVTGERVRWLSARKSRCLYELSKAVKGGDAQRMIAEQREAIIRLREKLARNEAAILAHLNAVNEVAGLIQGAIQHAEADGTYSEGEFGRR